MRIALLAPAEHPIPPARYGGKELMITELANGLVERGHEVHLYAPTGSMTRAILHPIFEGTIPELLTELGEPENHKLHQAYSQAVYAKTLEMIIDEDYDIIHNHQNWRFVTTASLLRSPLVTTWHTDLLEQYMRMIGILYPASLSVSISDNQRRACPNLAYRATVYNGIDMQSFAFNPQPEDYLAFLGRISPDKGITQAIDVATAAGMRLKIGGTVAPAEREYFETAVKPRIDGNQIQFLSEVDHAQKVALLGGAKALLGLVQWEEPFGIFIIEALACGTPVIATRRGAIPEILQDGANGFIVENTVEAAVEAIARLDGVSRISCRSSVEERFSSQKMVSAYEAVYASIISSPNQAS